MDFTFLPPEINSARMYTGPGSGPLLAAAGSWDSLAAELNITAQTYESVLSGLTSLHWRGPAAHSMSAAAAPYMGWLHITAEQTRQTATQARAAAAAYELAHAMTVPPLAVTANRTQLAALIATNFFGQNAAAIAATEAQYAEYWAQDAAAMSGYAANSAAAAQLTPFSSPQQTTNASGLTAQNAAVTQANASAAASSPASQAVSTAAQAAADPPSLTSILPSLTSILGDGEFGIFDAIQGTGTAISGFDRLDESVTAGPWGRETLGDPPGGGGPGAAAKRRGVEPRRWCGPGQCNRSPCPCRNARVDVRAGQLVGTVEQPRYGVVGQRLTHPPGDRRTSRIRVRYGRHTRDARKDSLASHGRRPPVRRPAHRDGTPAGGRMTGR